MRHCTVLRRGCPSSREHSFNALIGSAPAAVVTAKKTTGPVYRRTTANRPTQSVLCSRSCRLCHNLASDWLARHSGVSRPPFECTGRGTRSDGRVHQRVLGRESQAVEAAACVRRAGDGVTARGIADRASLRGRIDTDAGRIVALGGILARRFHVCGVRLRDLGRGFRRAVLTEKEVPPAPAESGPLPPAVE
jgi:hypothetical protein